MNGYNFIPVTRLIGYGGKYRAVLDKAIEGKPYAAYDRPIDALEHAMGPVLELVELEGDVTDDHHQLSSTNWCSRHQEDVSEILHRFALVCAKWVCGYLGQDYSDLLAAKRDWMVGMGSYAPVWEGARRLPTKKDYEKGDVAHIGPEIVRAAIDRDPVKAATESFRLARWVREDGWWCVNPMVRRPIIKEYNDMLTSMLSAAMG